MIDSSVFSEGRKYRYTLYRKWEKGEGTIMFIGLNPSTADETEDDPTIRRCVSYAKTWGYQSLCMTNLFGFRATKPNVMMKEAFPIGRMNDAFLTLVAEEAALIVAAWGNKGSYMNRDVEVMRLFQGKHSLYVLRLTKNGHPAHPLYLPKTLPAVIWKN